MAIPKKVLEQEAEAERAMDEMQRRKDAADQSLSQSEQSLSPEAVEVIPDAEVNQPAPMIDVADPEPEANEQPDETSLQNQLAREIQLRKTLEGRLRSQLKPANEEIRRLRQSLEETQKTIKQIQEEGKSSGAETYLNEDEREELGDVLDINERIVRGVLEERLGKDGSIEDLVRKIIEQNSANKQSNEGPSDDFWPLVDQLCPGSRDLNKAEDARWLEFLGKYSTTTGMQNRDEATAAIDNDDPSSLADIFSRFMREYGIVQNAEAPALPASKHSPRPERAGGGKQTAAAKQKKPAVWTELEVNAFYTDVSKGHFRGREAEFKKLDDEIMAATQAGLIRS